jgi:CHAT domain-containing protein
VTRDVRQLYVVAHGVLNYLPFAVLSDGSHLLVERVAVAYLPSAAMIAEAKRRYSGTDSMLVVAPSRSRLQHAPEEASAIDALFRPNSRLLAGDEATETRFRAMAGHYRNLHLATHGYFNKQNPLLSGIELEPDAEQDGLLEVHEIMGLKLNADLVTLSACQTGLGAGFFSDVPAGDDFVGLTRAFLYAGSESVLATLWEVDDRSTGLLMEAFYKRLGHGSDETKSAALAYAQQQIRSNPKYRHPYYWAAFVLVGASDVHPISREKHRGVKL